MIDLGPAPAVPSKEQALAKYRTDIEKLIRESVNLDVDTERSLQLRNAQKADLYWRGLQWLYPQITEQGVIAYSSMGSPIAGVGRDSNTAGAYDYVQNIYQGDGRKFVAVLGQRMPNIKAMPDDPDDEDSMRVTRLADTSATFLRAQWQPEERSLDLAFNLWNFGTTFAYTPWTTNGFKYGYRNEPNVVPRTVASGPPTANCLACGHSAPAASGTPPACPNCGDADSMSVEDAPKMEVPEVQGYAQYENGAVELHLTNIFTTSTSFYAKNLEDASWLSYEFDEYKYRLLKLYPELRKNRSQEGGSVETPAAELGTQVRSSSASPLAIPSTSKERWNYRRIWIKPDIYQAIEDDATVEELANLYPNGMKLTLVQGRLVDIEDERLTDVWAVCKPEPSQYIFADGVGYGMMPTQDLRNDCAAIAYQTIEGGLPPIFVDPRTINVEWWDQNPSTPNRIIPVLGAVGSNLQDSFYQPPPSQFSDQMQPWIQWEHDTARTNTGINPGIFGEGYGDQEAAHTTEVKKQMAMAQIATHWVMIRGFWPRVFTNGVRQLAKYGAGQISNVKEGDEGYEKKLVEISELSDTGWHFESAPGFPMTYEEQRAVLLWTLSLPQPVLDGIGMTHPRNVSKAQNLLGLTAWYSPNSDEHEKAQETIHELLKGQPIMQPPAQPGQPPPEPQPSIPIDMFEDNHGVMAQEAAAWCISAIGRQARIANEQGYQNVVAWGKAHSQAAAPPQPPPEPVTTRFSVSGKLSDMTPEERQKFDQDVGLAGGGHPLVGQQPSAPAPPGSNLAGVPPPAMPAGGPQPAQPQIQ